MPKESSDSPYLFRVFPGEDPRSLIVRYPYQDDSHTELGYAEAAKRLAQSFSGQPIDDVILMPFLFLWRHAIELSLKGQIKTAARFRRCNGEDDPSLKKDDVAARLTKTHRIAQLAKELADHFSHLDLPAMPDETRKTLDWLVAADPNGVAFRYSGNFPDTQDFIDFPKLSQSLEETYNMVAAGADVLWAYGEAQEDYLDAQRELQAEYKAEMRQYIDYNY